MCRYFSAMLTFKFTPAYKRALFYMTTISVFKTSKIIRFSGIAEFANLFKPGWAFYRTGGQENISQTKV